MNTEDSKIDLTPVTEQLIDTTQQLMTETDTDKTRDLISLFNWNMSKKNVARLLKLNNLYDDVTDQMVRRFVTKPDQFSNSDLLDYMKAVQTAISVTTQDVASVETPPKIVQNNTQINVNVVDGFDRESRSRILAAIKATLKDAEQSTIVVEQDKT